MPADFPGSRCIKATARAILCVLDDGREIWIPQSQVDADSEVFAEGDEGKLVISDWFAEKEGLF